MGRRHDPASESPAREAGPPPGAGAAASLPAAHPAADALSDVLEVVKLTGALFFLVDASLPWAADIPASPALAPAILPRAQHVVSYHLVLQGACWCRVAGGAPVRLDAGDVIVLPRGDAYLLTTAPDGRSGATEEQALAWFRQMALGELPFVVNEAGGGGAGLHLACGFLGCDALPFNPVLGALPPLLHVRRPSVRGGDQLDTFVELAVRESRAPGPGSRSVLLRLGELMFVEVLRRTLISRAGVEGGWLEGLRDPLVGRALAALHARPGHPWTIEKLARAVASSRSVLAERFTHFVGEPPMHYLARWRMQQAAGLLSDRSAKVSAVARRVGYDSEAAFSRAFKKLTGVPPAAWRDRRTVSGPPRAPDGG